MDTFVPLRAKCENDWTRDGIEIRFYSKDGSTISLITDIVLTSFDYSQPTEFPNSGLRLSRETAQELMDELWRCGIRPQDGTGSAGQIGAMQENIKDLRGFVEKLYRIAEKG